MCNKISEIILPLALAAFLFAAVFGVAVGMEMEDGQMSSCPFMANQASICQMNATEHTGRWQQAFLSVPAKSNALILALLLTIFAVILFVKYFSQPKQTEVAVRLQSYCRDTASKVLNPILLAFSDGILNPKICESAIL